MKMKLPISKLQIIKIFQIKKNRIKIETLKTLMNKLRSMKWKYRQKIAHLFYNKKSRLRNVK